MAATGIQFWVNGPAPIYVGTGAAGALESLGITEAGDRAIQLIFQGHFEEVYSDDLGPGVPRDVQYFSEHAFIRVDLNQWDETVWEKCCARVLGGTMGTTAQTGPGTMMQTESKGYEILIDAPYAAKSQYIGMPPYRFLMGWLDGQIDTGPMGTKYKRQAGMFHCIPKRLVDGSFILMNKSTAGKPSWP